MTIYEIKDLIKSNEYDFLREDPYLGSNIILLGLGGSHAYGTNTPSSDLDVRGVALNSKEEILYGNKFEQVINNVTDTTVYSFEKMIKLLTSANPNTIEILGLKPEHYLYLHPIGQELLNNKDMFLSKRVIHSFGGYANQQLRRLSNKSARLVEQAEQEKHILNSITNASYEFKNKFFELPEDAIKLYLDFSEHEEYDEEIFMDINLKHYPLRDYKGMMSEMGNIIKEYSKIGRRNTHAIERNKLGKHSMHLIRLYLMCLDILERGEIITYREKDHDFLMEIRNGKYLDENRQPIPEFFEMIDEYEKKLDYAKKHTELPDKPDFKRIKEFVININEKIVKGDV